eukprot:4059179-Amphidinium_carterae.1
MLLLGNSVFEGVAHLLHQSCLHVVSGNAQPPSPFEAKTIRENIEQAQQLLPTTYTRRRDTLYPNMHPACVCLILEMCNVAHDTLLATVENGGTYRSGGTQGTSPLMHAD